MDSTLYLARDEVRLYDVDGEQVPVREWDIQTELPLRCVLPIFEYVSKTTGKPRRIIAPYFQYDSSTRQIVGEEGEETTLDERMVAVIKVVRACGFDEYDAETIRTVPGAEQYVRIHVEAADGHGNAMCCLPHFDEMWNRFQVPAVITPGAIRPKGLTRLKITR